jgi:beta-N-acetylhexosaminidase
VDVGAGGADPLGPRSFSDDPVDVSRYGAAVVSAFRSAGMLSAPGHFPGIGAAAQSTDEGPTSVGLDMGALGRRDLPPFRAVIKAGAPAVLVGHASYAPDSFVVPASLSREIETNLLRGGLGFRGIAITDDLDAGAIVTGNSVAKAAVEAVQAGADMVWISHPDDWEPAYGALLAAVKARRISLVRLNAAVTRIVTVKRELGLHNRAKPKPVTPGTTPGTIPGTTTPAPAPTTTTP